MKTLFALIITMALLVIPSTVMAQELMIYPAEGQSQEQMERDKFECYSWAKSQSGFDPVNPPQAAAPTPPPAQPKSSSGPVKGAIKGGVAGTVVGAATGGSQKDMRRSARIGMGAGAVAGTVRKGSQASAQRKQAEQAAQTPQEVPGRDAYNRANAACLEAKGYTVK